MNLKNYSQVHRLTAIATFTALSFPPRSDAIDADILVSLPLNLLSLGANVGCSTPCRPVFHATVLARYPLSYTFKLSLHFNVVLFIEVHVRLISQ